MQDKTAADSFEPFIPTLIEALRPDLSSLPKFQGDSHILGARI